MPPRNKILLAAVLLFSVLVSSVLADTNVTPGASATLSVTADGTAPFTYTWTKDGGTTPLSTAATLAIASMAQKDVGTYTVKVSNSAGSTTASITLAMKVMPPSNANISLVEKLIAWIKAFWNKQPT